MATVLDIVTDALRELNVLAAGEVASADEANSGKDALNRLIDQWAAERLQVYKETRTTFTITSGTQAYSVGTGGTVSVARPTTIQKLNFYDTAVSPVNELPLNPLTFDAWAELSSKSLTSAYPTDFWYNHDFPFGSIKLWPIPTSSTLIGVLYAPEQVSEFSSLATAISLPPGWRRMMVKHLAVEMGPSFEKQPSPALSEQAADSMRIVKRSNFRMRDLGFEFTNGAAPSFDIEEG